MTNKHSRDWTFDVPWGKIALVSWGKINRPPVLMVHGYLDSAATFIPLLAHLPADYYYVGVDLPGNGKSDPFPDGLTLNHAHMVEVIRKVIQYMKWDTFIFMGHSFGCMIGTFYNAAFPGKITKMINFDPFVLLSMFYHTTYHLDQWANHFYTEYYENYKKFQSKSSKTYTYSEAINLIAKIRSLSKRQAEIIMSRSLIPAGNDRYRFTHDEKFKRIAGLPIDKEGIKKILLISPPCTLNICTKYPKTLTYINKEIAKSGDLAKEIEKHTRDNFKTLITVVLDSLHDFHVTHTVEIAPHIVRFLNLPCKPTMAKL